MATGRDGAPIVKNTYIFLPILASLALIAGCSGNVTARESGQSASQAAVDAQLDRDQDTTSAQNVQQSSVFDLFSNANDPNT